MSAVLSCGIPWSVSSWLDGIGLLLHCTIKLLGTKLYNSIIITKGGVVVITHGGVLRAFHKCAAATVELLEQYRIHLSSIISLGWQNGKSFLDILDDVKSSLSPLDIPFTVMDNIALPKTLFPPICYFKEPFHIEGVSAVDPSSAAKSLKPISQIVKGENKK
ncbi:unnamed protein product [Dovyalis caffra]|uniref:Uncharacterized protein n=1 Tax=Dovyalis caffra TaxID=77055 RepID=A0AAV1R0Y3_9ROSI|nr:unnamed protein product [Dovyalis caffra]